VMKKYVSIILILIISFFLVTGASMLPKLDIAKGINIMSILKVLNLPQRTLIYINKLFTGEKNARPLLPLKEKSSDDLFRLLIISLMGAIVVPVTFRLTRPGALSLYSCDTSGGISGRSPPSDSKDRQALPASIMKFNSARERRSTVCMTADSSEDGVSGQSDSDSDNSNLSFKTGYQIAFDGLICTIYKCMFSDIPHTYMCKQRDIFMCREEEKTWRLLLS
jgi:hypothetical protein